MLQRRHAGSTKSARGGAAAVMESLQPQKPAKNPRARSSSVADFEQDRAAEQTLRAFAMIAASDHRFATARNDRGQAGRAPQADRYAVSDSGGLFTPLFLLAVVGIEQLL